MATKSGQAGGLHENQLLGEYSDQCRKCGEIFISDKPKTIQLECEKCHVKPVKHIPHVDPFVQSEENEHEEMVLKVEEDSDEEMNNEEEDVFNIISNVKVTLNEKVEGTVNPLPKVSKTNDVKFEDYEFEEVDMKEVVKEKEETPVDEVGVKEEDGLLTPKIEPSNAEDIGPNLLTDIVLGFYGRQFLQTSNTEESKPSPEQIELKCSYCLKQFSKRSALMCHVKDVHEKNGDFACGFCEKRFYRKSAFIDHERKHTGEKPFVCVECGKAYDRKSYLNIHMQMHGERYPCDICEKTFSLKKNLGKHIKYVHEKVKNFCCEICSKTFGRTEHLKRHIEDMHEEHGENLHKCENCDSSFRKEDQLKLHIRYVHENEKNFVCDTCAKAFPRKASLDRHIADIHEQSGSNACQFCEKRFYKPHALKIHERKHTNEKPFACGFCDKKYHRAMDKDAHERKHTGEKPFQCESCGVSFRSQALKRYHKKSHVEILKQENEHFDPSVLQPNVYNELNSPQPIMNNQKTQSSISTINTHSDEKPYKCEICGEGFISQALKQDHMNSHIDSTQALKKDHMNSHVDSTQALKQDHMNSHVDSTQALKQVHMNSHLDRSQALKQDHINSHEDRSQALKQNHMNSHVDRRQALKQDHINSHEDRSQALKQNRMNSHVDRSQALKQDHINSHEDRSQALKQNHMNSHAEHFKHRSAQYDPSVLQPNVHNALYSPLPIMNNQSAQLNRSTNILHSEEKPCKREIFGSQTIKHDHMKSHEEVLKHRSAQFDPSVLPPNIYNTLYSPPALVNKQTSPNTTNTKKTLECEKCGESFISQAMKHYHMQFHVEVPKHGNAHFDLSALQPNMYNPFNSSLPLMKKQTALYRSSQSTTGTEERPFQCSSFRSQAEKPYCLKSHEEVLRQGSAQYDPSVQQPNVYNSLYSSQQIVNNQTVQPGNSPSTHPDCTNQ